METQAARNLMAEGGLGEGCSMRNGKMAWGGRGFKECREDEVWELKESNGELESISFLFGAHGLGGPLVHLMPSSWN